MSGFLTDSFKSILGGGIPGSQPIGVGYVASGIGSLDTITGNSRGVNRSVLRRSFGNMYNDGLQSSPLQIATKSTSLCGSFRAATMAGDVLGEVNSATNKKYGIEHNNVGKQFSSLNLNQGGLRRDGAASYAGNPKKVYDASDFIRYKKLKSINQTYNDKSAGGDQHNASQHAWSRVKM